MGVLQALAIMPYALTATPPSPKRPAVKLTAPAQPTYSPEAGLELDTLKAMMSQAMAAQGIERWEKLAEFLKRSEPFANQYPKELSVWIMRATAAVEVNEPMAGWTASQKLKTLGALNSDDACLRQLLVDLNMKGWMSASEEEIQNQVRMQKQLIGQWLHRDTKYSSSGWNTLLTLTQAGTIAFRDCDTCITYNGTYQTQGRSITLTFFVFGNWKGGVWKGYIQDQTLAFRRADAPLCALCLTVRRDQTLAFRRADAPEMLRD